MSPKLLAMCGIVKRSYGGEFESNIADSELHNLGALSTTTPLSTYTPHQTLSIVFENDDFML